MPDIAPSSDPSPGTAREFTTTHWSVVVEAGLTDSPNAAAAMARLCEKYWYPLYLYVRRKGHSTDDAKDLTQEFFARLLARNFLNAADRNRGRFRSFLLGALEHFLAREWTKGHAQKRGGGQPVFSLDELDAENRYLREPIDESTPDKIFARRWATTVLQHAMERLREECHAERKQEFMKRVEGLLSGEKSEAAYAQIGAELGLSEGAVKVAVHRLRRRFGELVRAEIAETVADSESVNDELRELFDALRD
jgi:RNA polymerase sigma-70 factor (ECF subfamily)